MRSPVIASAEDGIPLGTTVTPLSRSATAGSIGDGKSVLTDRLEAAGRASRDRGQDAPGLSPHPVPGEPAANGIGRAVPRTAEALPIRPYAASRRTGLASDPPDTPTSTSATLPDS